MPPPEGCRLPPVAAGALVRAAAGACTLLASGVDTTREFEEAAARGFQLFQGLFFQKPSRSGQPGIGRETGQTLQLLELLGEPASCYREALSAADALSSA